MDPEQLDSEPSNEEQLRQLENAYAELLIDDMDAKVLANLWQQIKELRGKLQLPVYGYTRPGEPGQ